MKRIVSLVEGEGDAEAVPILLRKVASRRLTVWRSIQKHFVSGRLTSCAKLAFAIGTTS